jgi:type I restriction enzyme S subunit
VRFLCLYFQTPGGLEILGKSSPGSAGRNRTLGIDRLLVQYVPLPPKEVQQGIIARVNALAAKVGEARRVGADLAEQCDALARSLILSCPNPHPTLMRELVRLREPDVVVHAQESYHFAGMYCFGRGVFRGQVKQGMEFAYDRLTRLRAGDFVYPKLMAWEGALAIVPPDCDGLVVSTEFPVFDVNTERVMPEVLDTYFRTPEVWPALSGSSTGTNVRRRRLKPADFLNYRMPLPPMEIQLKLRAVKARLEMVKAEQARIAAELDAMMPAALDRAFRGELSAPALSAAPLAAPVTDAGAVGAYPPQRSSTPYMDDAAVLCVLIDELRRRNRPTDEFTIQKHTYTGKEIWSVPINSAFARKIAGPWSHELRQKAIFAATHKNWLRMDGNQFVPGHSFNKGLAHAATVLGDGAKQVAAAVADLEKFGAGGLGRWATVLMAARDLERAAQPITRENIQREIDNWPGKRAKKAFSEESVDRTIDGLVKLAWIKLNQD